MKAASAPAKSPLFRTVSKFGIVQIHLRLKCDRPVQPYD
jgi:hypothetical protein